MKYIFTFLFALSGITASLAQPDTAHWSGVNFDEGKTYYTYGDQVTLRSAPNVEAEKIAIIPINSPVTFLDATNNNIKVYGFDNPWVKVSYNGKEGFVASGLLALRSIKLSDGSDLLYVRGVESAKNEGLQVLFRRIYDDSFEELGRYELPNSSFNVTLNDGKGLTGVDHIVQIDFLSEACGEEGGRSYLLLLADNTVNYLGLFSSVGDGGVYHASEDLTFPFDSGGRNDCIIFNGEEGEEDENGLYRTVSYTKVYGWSADGLSEPIVIPSYK
jgi:hypothetical protein